MSATTSAVVLATSLAAAFGLALAIRRFDDRASRQAVTEAERIVRRAYTTDATTWPNGGRR